MNLYIRETKSSDLHDIYRVHCEAFGYDKEAELARDLLNDSSAQPRLSLIAFHGEQVVGHILFTKAKLWDSDPHLSLSLLAPLAVVPDAQRQGVGGELIKAGLEYLAEAGTDLVFVLGHPEYYPKHGFKTAAHYGLKAPYPIPEKHVDAWMVKALNPKVLGEVCGTVICCDALNKEEHWSE
ncbi:GNAT family N-acetyltransferase [Psychromonas aquimarina]|uniref:GNAT family N-acetyltransferase n=1 Tax=Psychromonas aquimarina TaxID=444919 RepID=UPI0003F8DCA5|nr:N-acetyltransferase [Psychromonas aquimarina]